MIKEKKFSRDQYHWKKGINYRQHPEYYAVGKGEQGVLICEPYKSEILPFWRFKTVAIAKCSARKIYCLFLHYLADSDFVGADMARKYLQMGFTRSRRYTNYKGGKKYTTTGVPLPKGTGEKEKANSAAVFYKYWKKAEMNATYQVLKKDWKKKFG